MLAASPGCSVFVTATGAQANEVLNALDATAMASVVARYHIDSIFNLVALLSAVGERNPQMAWNVNMGALNNSLEVARQHHCALFTPSSIGAFGMFVTPFLMGGILWHSLKKGAPAAARAWEGAKGLEWTVPSPAPHHTFGTPPVIRPGDLAHDDITH